MVCPQTSKRVLGWHRSYERQHFRMPFRVTNNTIRAVGTVLAPGSDLQVDDDPQLVFTSPAHSPVEVWKLTVGIRLTCYTSHGENFVMQGGDSILPSVVFKAQYPIGTRTWFKPVAATAAKSSEVFFSDPISSKTHTKPAEEEQTVQSRGSKACL